MTTAVGRLISHGPTHVAPIVRRKSLILTRYSSHFALYVMLNFLHLKQAGLRPLIAVKKFLLKYLYTSAALQLALNTIDIRISVIVPRMSN